MRLRFWNAALAALALTVTSCADGPTAPVSVEPASSLIPLAAVTMPPVRIAEIHYDDASFDSGEAIEVSAPTGTALAGWRVVLYNGSATQRSAYDTTALDGLVPAACGTRSVVVVSYPVDGIQNGAPDGVALVDPAGTVVEFLSYEGTFTAASGFAAGMTSVDIGVSEAGSTAEGETTSLKRTKDNTWEKSSPRSFGSCNDFTDDQPPAEVDAVTIAPESAPVLVGGTHQFAAEARDAAGAPIPGVSFTWTSLDPAVAGVTGGLATALAAGTAHIVAAAPNGRADTATLVVSELPPPDDLPAIRFSELHYDNANADVGEAIEIEGPAGASVEGWRVVLYNGSNGLAYDTRVLAGITGTIGATCTDRGVIVLNYPGDGIQNGPDALALVNAAGEVIELLSYEGELVANDGPAAGRRSVDIGVSETSATVAGRSLKRDARGDWSGAESTHTFGGCNANGPIPTVTVAGRGASDPLPVGFQTQLFPTLRNAQGAFVPTTFTWSSETPDLASIDARGFARALGAGDAILRATAADGTSGIFFLRIQPATRSASAQYANHLEFGRPTDADASNDHLVEYGTFTVSYDGARGIPNWVSYNLEASHFGPQDRCDCFSFDDALPASFARYTTADYNNASIVNGFDIDRGHLVRSEERGAGVYDNASTFWLTNIIPQARDKNQGPWGRMELDIQELAEDATKELWVIAGATGSKGTVRNEGVITIPTHTWKVVVVAPRNTGLANVDDFGDLEVIAVNMPNEPGSRTENWRSYETTVDAIEALSGYDLLSLLPDHIETALESRTRPPVAAVGGPYVALEGSAIGLSASESSDPDGQALSYAWSFGDGATADVVSPTHAWAQDGEYAVRVIVTDPLGLADTATTTVTVRNVAPTIAPLAGATLLPGETFATTGSFADPGADEWTATVDYGDGSGTQPLALDGGAFTLSHRYARAGTFTVTVWIADDDATVARTATVRVLTTGEALGVATTLLEPLVEAGTLARGEAQSLAAKLLAAQRTAIRGPVEATLGQLGALLNELDALAQSGRLSSANAAQLRTLVERIVTSLGA